MTDKPTDPQCFEYRLVVIDAPSMGILTTTAAVSGPILPRALIQAGERVAEAVTETIEQTYGLQTIQLTLLPGTEKLSSCAVHEIIDSRRAPGGAFSFVPLDQIASYEFADEERAIILKVMNGQATGLGRFARVGWIYELMAKIEGVNYREFNSLPLIRQLNQGIDFCLLSISDDERRKLWFKAVGEPNTREYALTMELFRRFPAYLPKIIATIPEWNGWVMEDVDGVPLNNSEKIHPCEDALTALATMQQELARSVASLSAYGAKNWTCARIALMIDPIFQEAQGAMQAQISTQSRPLSGSELDQLKKEIESAWLEFADAGIPETLVHGDIGHGNVLVTSRGPVFLDWAETYIAHPFLSAEHLLADLARSNPVFAEKQTNLRRHYAARWKTYCQPAVLERLIALCPSISAFAYATFVWDANRDRPDPTLAWPLLRSTLRRTRRELDQIMESVS